MRSANRDGKREEKLQIEIDKNYQTVISGGPKKFFSKQKVRSPFARPVSLPSPELTSLWFIELCDQLRLARLSRGLTQRQLAHEVQTTQKLICQLENGKSNPTAEILDRICQVLEIELKITVIKKAT